MSSVCCTNGTRNVSTPQERASWSRTEATGVKASSGRSQCSRDSRRTVSPVCENATSALAPIARAIWDAATVSAPPCVRGSCCSRGTAMEPASVVLMIFAIVLTVSTG